MIARNDFNDDSPNEARPRPEPRRLPEKPSAVEIAKAASDYLRGGIKQSLDDPAATRFEDKDESLLKFHGMYQQYDRDARAESRGQSKQDRLYSLMVRCRIPGGVLTPDQYLALDDLARVFGHGAIRLTARQSIQFHGVLKGDVKALIQGLNDRLVSTLAACGDVMRNVMCCPAIDQDPIRAALQKTARDLALALAPRTTAYHDIWLDGEKLKADHPYVANGKVTSNGQCRSHECHEFEVEPWYGKLYLPRKFKMGLAVPEDNCIDIYTQDCGLLAITDASTRSLIAFNLLVGGGLGMTHRKEDTFARLATSIGSIAPESAVEAVRVVLEIFRDYGNREDRRHARLKYVIEEFGIDWFIDEFNRRASFKLAPSLPHAPLRHQDHMGWSPQGDGRWTYGLFVENGRLRDDDDSAKLTGIREAVARLGAAVRITPHQSILFTDLRDDRRKELLTILRAHRIRLNEDVSKVRRHSMACPALPTCGLALSDAERVLPSIITRIEQLLEQLDLSNADLGVRMTGCPNGCARPYVADIGLVGRSPGVYDVYCGGGLAGDRLVDLLAEKVNEEDIVDVLRPVLTAWRDERLDGEGFGDYWHRMSGRAEPRTILTGSKDLYNPTLHGEPIG